MARRAQAASKAFVPFIPIPKPRHAAPIIVKAIDFTVQLLELPAELLLGILSLTRPDGFESLALSCQRLYSLALDSGLVSEHNDMKRLWRIWDLGLDPRYEWVSWHPLIVLAAIHENPLVAEYIRIVRFPYSLQAACEESESSSGTSRADMISAQALSELVGKSPYLRASGMTPEQWVEEMLHRGNDVALAVLMLTLLPNITHLKLSREWSFARWESGNGYDSESPSLDVGQIFSLLSNPNIGHALSKLAVIEPWTSDSETGTALRCLIPFLTLPSVRKIVGFQLVADHSYDDFSWPYMRSSRIEEIELTCSGISATHIARFLEPMHHLRSLRYHHMGMGGGAAFIWDAGSFLASIRNSRAANTLEELSLSAKFFDGPTSAPSSFKEFKRLRWLELGVDLLLARPENGQGDLADWEIQKTAYSYTNRTKTLCNLRLVDILPPSLEKLRLLVNEKVDSFTKLFDGLAEGKVEALPSLTDISLSRCYRKIPPDDSTRPIHFLPLGVRQAQDRRRMGEEYHYEKPLSLDGPKEELHAAGIEFQYVQELNPQAEHLHTCRNMS